MNWTAWTIAKRELKSLFVSPVAYVVLGLFSLGTGWYFSLAMERFDSYLREISFKAQQLQSPEALEGVNLNSMLINNVTSFTFMLLLFGVPFFTMRLLSEEKINRTYELLLTSPVSILNIVLGKFLAGGIFLFVLLATQATFLISMFAYGNPEVGPVISSYLGVYLSGLAFIAIGVFASSITKYQIIAVLLSWAVNLGLLLISFAADVTYGNLGLFIRSVSISPHFESFNKGIIQVSSLVYFVSLVILFIAATQISVKSIARN